MKTEYRIKRKGIYYILEYLKVYSFLGLKFKFWCKIPKVNTNNLNIDGFYNENFINSSENYIESNSKQYLFTFIKHYPDIKEYFKYRDNLTQCIKNMFGY